MRGPSRERLLTDASEKTLAIAGTSPTSALVGAVVTYLGVRLVRWDRSETAG